MQGDDIMTKVIIMVNGFITEAVMENGLVYTRSKVYRADDPKINILKSE